MNESHLRNLTDTQLEQSIAVVRSRELTTLSDMLAHLREVDRRRLYSKRGFKSLHDYAIRKLKYSEDQAHRRVSAARLARDLPEIETKIADGSLKLTHLTDAHTFFRKVEHSREEKLAILEKLENTNRTEARKVLQREEVLARYYFEADKRLEEVIERLRGLHPQLSFDELMRKVCLLAHDELVPLEDSKTLEKFRAARKISRVSTVEAASEHIKERDDARASDDRSDQDANLSEANKSEGSLEVGPDARAAKVPSRYIPTHVRREVWINAQGKCQNCSSKFALEYDHILPFALGGNNSVDNLRLLCRSCNQRKAIETFGLHKMTKHLGGAAQNSKANTIGPSSI